MIARNLFLLLFLIFNMGFAGAEDDCRDSLRELFKSSPVAQEKLREFLKLQSGITLHRLAYASVRSSGQESEFRLEREILKMLNQVKEKNNADPEFAKVHELFNDHNNKLSRTALAKALPYVADILNEQQREQSAFERAHFNLGEADIKILAILAEREEYANGQYASALWRDVSSDKSILNFAKIINSSVRTSGGSSQGMLERMDKRISELHKRASDLLGELDLSDACKKAIAACVVDEGSKTIIQPELSGFLTTLVNEVELSDRHKSLRYDDVWLYTGRKGSKAGVSPHSGGASRQRPPVQVYQAPEEDPDTVIHNYLVEKVLASIPQLFSREDLMSNRELTLALARAIDEGIMAKKGEERIFSFNGKRYYLPELWNSETRESGDGKLEWAWNKVLSAGDKVGDWWGIAKTRRFVQGTTLDVMETFGVDVGKRFPHIEEDDLPDFLTTMHKQKDAFGHKFTFVFQDKLYDLETGKEIEKGANAFLSKFQVEGSSSEPLDSSPFTLSKTAKEVLAEEIKKGNHSFVSGDKALHVSGAPVDFDVEYERARRDYVVADGGGVREPFPSKEKVRELSQVSGETNNLTLKTLADRKRAFSADGKGHDIFKGDIDRSAALEIVINNRKRQGVNRSVGDYSGMSDSHLVSNAVAIMNDEPVFEREGKQFYSDTGRAIASNMGDSAVKGLVNDDRRQLELERINSGDDLSVVLDFHKRFPSKQCESFTVLDKKSAKIRVYKVEDGVTQILWESEALLGAAAGDESTEHRGGVSGPVSNNKTAAGVFTVGEMVKGKPDYLSILDGPVVAASLSEAGSQKSTYLNDGNDRNNRSTNGGVLLGQGSLAAYRARYMKAGCPFYILPETDKVKLKITGNQIGLQAERGAGGDNFHVAQIKPEEPKAITITPKREGVLNETAKKFLESLEKNKERIMTDLGITNAEYNQMAKVAFGILGVESQFGDGLKLFPEGFSLGNLANPRRHKEKFYGGAVVFLGKLLKRGEVSTDPDERSRGLTQIKGVEDYPLIQKFGGINRDNLMEPEKAAVATMYVLGEMLDRLKKNEDQHSGITDKNRMEYLYYIYNGQQRQIANASATPELNERAKKVSAYADMLTIYSHE